MSLAAQNVDSGRQRWNQRKIVLDDQVCIKNSLPSYHDGQTLRVLADGPSETLRVSSPQRLLRAIKTCVTTLATISGAGVTQAEGTTQPTISRVKPTHFL
jgi:hypothetical protein